MVCGLGSANFRYTTPVTSSGNTKTRSIPTDAVADSSMVQRPTIAVEYGQKANCSHRVPFPFRGASSYVIKDDPPLSTGGVHERIACPSPGITDTSKGELGRPTGLA